MIAINARQRITNVCGQESINSRQFLARGDMSKKFIMNYNTYNTTISAARGGILHTLGFYCGKNVYGGVEDSTGGNTLG